MTLDVRAAVAFEAGQPLTVETVQLEGPREGEVLVEIKATGLCHTDKYTLSGADPEGLFPAILGHEGAGVVVDTGPGADAALVGRRVAALTKTGAWATHVVVAARDTVVVPDGVSAADAETVVVNGVTAWQLLHRAARVIADPVIRVAIARQERLHRRRAVAHRHRVDRDAHRL